VALAARIPVPASAGSRSAGPAALEVDGLVVPGSRRARDVDGVSLTLMPGEILGIAGVEGNGQTELIEALAGLRPTAGGTVRLAGHDVTTWSVRARVDAGLAHIPEDRHRRGLVLDWTIAENLVLGQQHRFATPRGLDVARIARHAEAQIQAFDIRPADPTLAARALSGGNQQKIVIARELGGGRDVRVLLAAQPTRGVDVGAIEFIHTRLREARDAGAAIVLVSADLSELLALSTRVAVMYAGRLVTTMDGDVASPERLGPWMMGATEEPAA
jgi:simple sugar transport system ATP-binding protein